MCYVCNAYSGMPPNGSLKCEVIGAQARTLVRAVHPILPGRATSTWMFRPCLRAGLRNGETLYSVSAVPTAARAPLENAVAIYARIVRGLWRQRRTAAAQMLAGTGHLLGYTLCFQQLPFCPNLC